MKVSEESASGGGTAVRESDEAEGAPVAPIDQESVELNKPCRRRELRKQNEVNEEMVSQDRVIKRLTNEVQNEVQKERVSRTIRAMDETPRV